MLYLDALTVRWIAGCMLRQKVKVSDDNDSMFQQLTLLHTKKVAANKVKKSKQIKNKPINVREREKEREREREREKEREIGQANGMVYANRRKK